MRQWKSIAGGVAVLCIAGAGVARADVTAQLVWQNWQDLLTTAGRSVTSGSETTSGDTLTVKDVKIGAAFEDGHASGTIPEIDFRNVGDGTVAITMSPEYGIAIKANPPEGGALDMRMRISQSDLNITASGDAQAISYLFSASKFGADLDHLKTDGKDVDLKLAVMLAGVNGSSTVTDGMPRTVSGTFGADSLALTAGASKPDGKGTFDATMTMQDLAGTSAWSVVDEMDMTDLNAALQNGMSVDSSITYGATGYSADVTDDRGAMHVEGSADSGGVKMALDKDRLQYGADSKGSAMTLSGDQIPVPQVTLKIAEAAFNLLMPVTKSDTPQDFALLTKIAGLSVGDEIWNMADPGGVLPHDPATLIVDLKGTANWLFDIFDPAQQEAPPKVPGQLHTLDLQALKLAAAGADLTGTGSFTFDNSDTRTYDGFPKPVGSVDLKLVGANALIDKLVSMHLLPADQATGARMMMGVFARPGDGKDTLVSRVELTPEGGVMANGQRLK